MKKNRSHLSFRAALWFFVTGLIASGPLVAQTAPFTIFIFGSSPHAANTSLASIGSTFTFTSYADGTAPFTYVWKKDGVVIAGASGATYIINPVATDSAGQFTVTVTNSAGSATSAAFGLSLRAPAPVITQQPTAQSVNAGDTLTLTASATGTSYLGFEWFKNGISVAFESPSGNVSTYTKTNAQSSDAGSYYVRVRSGFASEEAQSNSVPVTVATLAPVITQQPASATAVYLNSIILSVIADGRGSALRYTWYREGIAVAASPRLELRQSANPNSPNLAIGVVQPEYAGSYYVVVSNLAGQSVTSNTVTLSVASGIALTSQPSNQSITAGATATFGVTATYSTPFPGAPRYQWRKNGVDISGATSATLTLPNAQPADAGSYAVIVYYFLNGITPALSVLSDSATLAVNATAGVAPVITTQPAGQSVTAGSAATFTVAATSTPTPTYQWSKNGSAISGATGATYTISSTQSADAGNYTVTITNSSGAVTSATASLVVNSTIPAVAPTITQQPAGLTVNNGSNASFTVVATGTPVPTYQWRKNGATIAGATGANLNLTSVQVADVGDYAVVVTNSAGSVTSTSATLSVTPAPIPPTETPTITAHPVSQTATVGSTVTLSVTAVGLGPILSYAWYHSGRLMPGMLSAQTLTNVSYADGGEYYVTVANPNLGGSGNGPMVKSQTAILTILAATNAPAITTQPASQTAPVGGSVIFAVLASGNPAPTYQWYKRSAGAITAATGSTFSITSASTADVGDYYVVATNSQGSATSTDAHLTVSTTTTTVAPTIVLQPTAQNVTVGGGVNFSVVVNGTPAPSYQWHFNGGVISGATSASYARGNATEADSGSYFVRVSNSAGSIDSSSVLLSVLTPQQQLAITTQPVSQTTNAGSSVIFSVNATGSTQLSYQWFKDGQPISAANQATLSFSNVQTSQAGAYSVEVSTRLSAAPQTVISTSAQLTVTGQSSTAQAPAITSQPIGQSISAGGSASFSVSASGSGSLAYQWRKDGAAISGATGATFTIASAHSSDAGAYSVVVTNAAGAVTSAAANLAVASSPNYAGTYFGRFNNNPGDRFALVIRADGSAIFLGYAASLFTGYSATNIKINPDGSFTADLTEIKPAANTPAGDALPGLPSQPAQPVPATAITLRGSVAAGALTGGITGAALTVAAPKSPAAGVAQSAAGVYQTAALNSSTGGLTTIVDATGEAFVFSQTATGAAAGTGTLNTTTGQVTAILADNSQATATLNATSGSATATLTTSTKETLAFSGLAEGITRTDRLVNIASRGVVSSSDLMIAGFVITGASSKSVMIRATGPALAAFGVAGTVPNPKLELYRGTTKIQENDDWSLAINAADIVSTASRTGAFPLTAASADAVILTPLEPGGYTAQVSSVTGATGVALVEVYDAGTPAVTSTTPRLVNISTRANVAGGEGQLIAGIVITGNSPKKILIRATGPALTAFGVPGALADPLLKLYKGDTVLRENDNWSESSSEAALITAAGNATGAFALTVGTKDAALLITLEPGSYTAQVSGVAGATGAALVEVYEVP
jgi:hypothetical protein